MQSDLFGPKPTKPAKPDAEPQAAPEATPSQPAPTPSLLGLHGRALEVAGCELVRGLGVMLRASVDEVQQETRGAWRGRGWLLAAQAPTVSGGASWWAVLRLVWWTRDGSSGAWEVRASLSEARSNNKDLATHHAITLRLGLEDNMTPLDAHTTYQHAAAHLSSRGVVAPDACVKELAAWAVTAATQIVRAYKP